MAKFNFNLRDPKASGETAIHLIIRWTNNRLVYASKEVIHPDFWETDKEKKNFQRAITSKKFAEYPEFNARLDKIEKDAKDVFRQYENDNDHEQPNVEVLRELLNKKLNPSSLSNSPKDFFGFIEKFISDANNRINDKTGRPFADCTINVYERCDELLREFKQKKRKRIDFDTIDLDFYNDFAEYLKTEHKFATNTIGKHIKTLKTFLNEATERGLNTNFAYKSKRFKVTTENTESIYLNKDELLEIYNLDLSGNTRIDKVRDLFLVGCWTGLRFSDFSRITPENIKGDYIEIETQKTAEPVVIPIHSTVKLIMDKYKGRYPNSLPPSITNVKMNLYLKELGKMVDSLHTSTSTGITKAGMFISKNQAKYKLITTHTARRSFASNLYLDGVQSPTIMKITGHRTEKAFMRYIKITPNESAKLLKLHWEKEKTLKVV